MVEDIDIASYADADYNQPQIGANDINEVIHCLKKAADTLLKWLSDNLMKRNASKCHLLVKILLVKTPST